MAGLFSNPLNWQITDTFQGQSGGINPIKAVAKYTSPLVYVVDAAKDKAEASSGGGVASAPGYAPGSVDFGSVGNTPDVSPTNQSQLGGSTYGSGGGSSYNPDDIALYDNQIGQYQNALSRIANQRSIGEGNINSSYEAGKIGLDNQFNQAESQYNLQKQRSGQDYVTSRARIGAQAGNQLNSIRRILGAAGAGWTSAYSKLAPFAAAQQASQRFGEVQDTFGRNQQDLDTNWSTTDNEFKTRRGELDTEKQNKLTELYSGLAERESGINNDLAGITLQRQRALGGSAGSALQAIQPYQNRIAQLLGEIDNYGKLAVNSPKAISYAAPELDSYNYSQFDRPELGGDRRASYVSPFARLLREREEQSRIGY